MEGYVGFSCWRNEENYFFTVFNPLLPRSLSVSIVFAPPVVFMVPRTVIMKERKHTTVVLTYFKTFSTAQ